MHNTQMFYKKTDPVKKVTIINTNDETAFYQLSDGNMIKKGDFLKYYAVMENSQEINETKNVGVTMDYIDPDSFFSSSSVVNQQDLEKIKNADPNKGVLEGSQRTEVNYRSGDMERTQLMNESLVQQVDTSKSSIPNNTNTNTSQYKVYENEDESYEDFIKNKGIQQQVPQPQTQKSDMENPLNEIEQLYEDEKVAYGQEEALKRKDSRLKKMQQKYQIPQQQLPQQQYQPLESNTQTVLDPSEMMFKSFKRNHEIKISLDFNNKIGNPDFIKMMMENIDGDIISFYKKLIVKDIMDNFKVIENEVEKQLKEVIFGEPKKQKTKKNVVKQTQNKKVDTNKESDLIPGKTTKSGTQTYKFIEEDGSVKELIFKTAEKRGLKPLKKE